MINRWKSIGSNTRTMAIALILWAVGEGLWTYIQPLYLAKLGAEPKQIGLILSVSGVARLFLMLPSGMLADRYGARQLLIPGWVLGLVGVVFIAGATNLYVVGFGFFLYGASAMAIPVINLYLIQSIHHDETVTVRLQPQEILTFIHALFWMGVIVSPAVGGLIADLTSLRTVFWISAGWFMLSMMTLLRTKAYPVESDSSMSWSAHLKRYSGLFRRRRLLVLYTIFALAFITSLMGFVFVSKYLQDVYHLNNSRIGLLMSMMALGSFLWNLWLGPRLAWQSFVMAILLTGFSYALLISNAHWIVLVLACFLLGSWEVLRPVSSALITEYTTAGEQGFAFGIVDTLHALATLVAPAIAGIIYTLSPSYPFILGIGIIPLVMLGVYIFISTQRNSFAKGAATE